MLGVQQIEESERGGPISPLERHRPEEQQEGRELRRTRKISAVSADRPKQVVARPHARGRPAHPTLSFLPQFLTAVRLARLWDAQQVAQDVVDLKLDQPLGEPTPDRHSTFSDLCECDSE